MKCQQPYLYVDQANQLHILVPLAKGGFISVDNTCKTTSALRDFFGTFAGDQGQAIQSLTNFIDEVNTLDSSQINPVIKYQLIHQADKFIGAIQALKNIPGFEHLYSADNAMPFEKEMTDLIHNTGNVKSVRLSVPTDQDDEYLKLTSPDFTLPHSIYDFQRGERVDPEYDDFGSELRELYKPLGDKQKIIEVSQFMKDKGYESVNLDQIDQDSFRQDFKLAVKQLTTFDLDHWPSCINRQLNASYFEDMGFVDGDAVEDFVEALFNVAKDQFIINDGQNLLGYRYGYNGHGASIAIQLYLAHVSLYAQAKHSNQDDLGKRLESDQAFRSGLLDVVRNHLDSDQLNLAIFQYLQADLNLDDTDFAKINDWSQPNIQVAMQIDANWHPDEFMVVLPVMSNQQRRGFVHHNHISVDLVDFFNSFVSFKEPIDLTQIHSETIDQTAQLPDDSEIIGLTATDLSLDEAFKRYPEGTVRSLLQGDFPGMNEESYFASSWHQFVQSCDDLGYFFSYLNYFPTDQESRYQLYRLLVKEVDKNQLFDQLQHMNMQTVGEFYEAILLSDDFRSEDLTDSQWYLLFNYFTKDAINLEKLLSLFDASENNDFASNIASVAQETKNTDLLRNLILLSESHVCMIRDGMIDSISRNPSLSLAELASLPITDTTKNDWLLCKFDVMGAAQFFQEVDTLGKETKQIINRAILLDPQFNIEDFTIKQIIDLFNADDASQKFLAGHILFHDNSAGSSIFQGLIDSPDLSVQVLRGMMHALTDVDQLSEEQQQMVLQIASNQCFQTECQLFDVEELINLALRTKDPDIVFKNVLKTSMAKKSEKIMAFMIKHTDNEYILATITSIVAQMPDAESTG
ncbi:hypothetical protein N9Y17_01390, partial [Gammaproteobacteria bacterium]|nr:hypothetical protein [Gammaproteobacteria bacterium]